MTVRMPREGLTLVRLLMVLSSLSPLFALWAIRGTALIDDQFLVPICVAFILIPFGVLWCRIRVIVHQNDDRRELTVGSSEDHRSHILVYLFAILLPFYREEIETSRDMIAMIAAFVVIVFLFLWLNLHYINIFFVLGGYSTFVVSPPEDNNPVSGQESFVLITSRRSLRSNEKIFAYRLSNTVYFEKQDND